MKPKKRRRPVIECHDPSLTKQNFKDQCDINNIVENFGRTGQLPQSQTQPKYGESPPLDFTQTQYALAAATNMFNELSEHQKTGFLNVSDFLGALADPSRASELENLGIYPESEEMPSTMSTEPPIEETPLPADPINESTELPDSSNS